MKNENPEIYLKTNSALTSKVTKQMFKCGILRPPTVREDAIQKIEKWSKTYRRTNTRKIIQGKKEGRAASMYRVQMKSARPALGRYYRFATIPVKVIEIILSQ